MPGLSQLKKFSSDLLALGDEVVIRSSRGEKPVEVHIPKEVQDVDDSDAFVLGMPEGEELAEEEQIDEDLSDLAGIAGGNTSDSGNSDSEQAAPSFEAPDMSGLLDPIGGGDFGGDDMPDLSMFADEPVVESEPEPEEVIEEEPEEVSVADMGLDDLLSGGGFDEPEPEDDEFADLDNVNDDSGSENNSEAETENEGAFGLDDFGALDDLEDLDDVQPLERTGNNEAADSLSDFGDFGDFGDNSDTGSSGETDELGELGDLDNLVDSESSGNAGNDSGAVSSDDFSNGSLDDFFYDPFGNGETEAGNENGDESGLNESDNVEDADVVSVEEPEEVSSVEPSVESSAENPMESPLEDAVEPPVEDFGVDSFDEPGVSDDIDNLPDFNDNSDNFDISAPESFSEPENNDNEFDLGSSDFDLPDFESDEGNGAEDELTDLSDLSGLDDLPDLENSNSSDSAEETVSDDDFGDLPDFGDLDNLGGSENSGDSAVSDDFDMPDLPDDYGISENPDNSSDDFMSDDSLPDMDDFNLSGDESSDVSFDEPEPVSSNSDNNDDIEANSENNVSPDNADNIEEPFEDVSQEMTPEELDARFEDSADSDLDSPFDDFSTDGLDDLPDMSGLDEGAGDIISSDNSGEPSDMGDGNSDNSKNDEFGLDFDNLDITAKDDIPDYGDFNVDESSSENSEPLEVFDTSEMEGLDFDIPDTDSQLEEAENGSNGFEMGDEFEIPGFSDVETVGESSSGKSPVTHEDKKHKGKHSAPVENDSGVYEDDGEKDDLPPNTLSDKQYKTFLNNLKEYPLNVRLAFEELLVKDEFTDDAEFEVIEIILNKAPARQVAAKLEKMLDISIPVPRDYEHRSAGEYEAYKKSLSYQLKNKIIPAILLGIVGILVCIGLFNFGKNCIYKPLKANSLYKQGYVLIQEREYPLSEIKFDEATKYRLSKKWFFKYARGYRENKQYQRAGKMYKNILYCFNHDKVAGLEYADMELNDLANYQRAEEIVRREVLDYHINDADGILKLGDIFLEWGTEKDPSKFEDARAQYTTLLQLYGQTDLYLSRMMRYFIRTDNLREVLQLKQHFEPNKESLGSDDWTELSGYLLDKYYGELPPSEEYLRYEIEGLRSLLLRAVESNRENPVALYNLSKYFINTNETEHIESTLQDSIEKFNSAKTLKNRDIYKYIDAYRLLGEYYVNTEDFLQAQEQFAEGISLYITERDNAGFKGDKGVGKLYEDMGNLKYSISGDYDEALLNYNQSVNLGNDTPSIRYRIGYVQYHNRNYEEALSAFMKAGDGNIKERNLLLAMANTLSIRGDDYAAEGYYDQLIETLDNDIANRGLILPQANEKDYNIINTYLCASNNYGVTLYRLAKKTGDSSKNAEAIVQFSESVRAWDALTRNPETMIRLEGSNLAEQNIKYITHPISEFEPAIYTGIPKTLLDNEVL